MLDEFAALGRLVFFESQLAFMAGYGIRGFLITQSLNQLERAYGPNHAILDNCHIRILLGNLCRGAAPLSGRLPYEIRHFLHLPFFHSNDLPQTDGRSFPRERGNKIAMNW